MTHQNLSLGMCWKLFGATLNKVSILFDSVHTESRTSIEQLVYELEVSI